MGREGILSSRDLSSSNRGSLHFYKRVQVLDERDVGCRVWIGVCVLGLDTSVRPVEGEGRGVGSSGGASRGPRGDRGSDPHRYGEDCAPITDLNLPLCNFYLS